MSGVAPVLLSCCARGGILALFLAGPRRKPERPLSSWRLRFTCGGATHVDIRSQHERATAVVPALRPYVSVYGGEDGKERAPTHHRATTLIKKYRCWHGGLPTRLEGLPLSLCLPARYHACLRGSETQYWIATWLFDGGALLWGPPHTLFLLALARNFFGPHLFCRRDNGTPSRSVGVCSFTSVRRHADASTDAERGMPLPSLSKGAVIAGLKDIIRAWWLQLWSLSC